MTSVHTGLRAPLDEALGDEIRVLDVQIVRTWQLLAVSGFFGGFLVWWALDYTEGPAVSALSAVGFVWFSIQLAWLKRTPGRTPVVVGAVVESITPSAFLIAIGALRGPLDALGNYIPPLLFGAVMVACMARLRPRTTLFLGTTNAIFSLSVYFFYLRGLMSEAERNLPLLSPGMQIVRAIGFASGGVLAYLVTDALRRAIGRAERSVRATDLFGKYRLLGKIGAGGMGTVHRAVYCPEGGFERDVAVKLLHAHLADQHEFIMAFREEAELSARLAHPNIVQVLDFGRNGRAYFLAMEYVEGVTLGALTRRLAKVRRPVAVDVVAWIGQELLLGLAHSHGGARDAEGRKLHVVHRDLCPSNILVSTSGEVKISDFGVAKALRDATFSETKTIAGHPGYMAPEQVKALPIDERCDLFALGVVLWELLALEPLFRRGSEGLTAVAVLENKVSPISKKRRDLDEEWDRFFARALAPLPEDRFASAAEMSAALARLQTTSRATYEEEVGELARWARGLDVAASTPNTDDEPTRVTPPTT